MEGDNSSDSGNHKARQWKEKFAPVTTQQESGRRQVMAMLGRQETEISSHKETSHASSHKTRTCKETGSIQQCLVT